MNDNSKYYNAFRVCIHGVCTQNILIYFPTKYVNLTSIFCVFDGAFHLFNVDPLP